MEDFKCLIQWHGLTTTEKPEQQQNISLKLFCKFKTEQSPTDPTIQDHSSKRKEQHR